MHQSVVFQVNILVLNAAPEALYKDVIQYSPASVHADRNAVRLEYASKSFTGELVTLIGVEYSGNTVNL
jgi:hypothetical protein